MNTKQTFDFYEQLDDLDLDERGKERFTRQHPKKLKSNERAFLHKQDDSRSSFQFSYQAARFEQVWLLESLGPFYEQRWISDVLHKVKGGKEASVYLCQAGEAVEADLLAVKVYRPRMLRNLKQDHLYREGRAELDAEGNQLLDDRALHAIAKRTTFGELLRHQSWISYEYTTLQALYAAGADVPRPYALANNTILMDYVGDLGAPAPALSEVKLEQDEAHELYACVLRNLDILLTLERIHGDLSAYNILYWEGQITLIDFPQVVSPKCNRNAYRIFERDIVRTCEYFARMGVNCHGQKLAAQLWTKHGYPLQQEIHPRLLDAENPQDRSLWQKQERER
jgi:RIO kinase 1